MNVIHMNPTDTAKAIYIYLPHKLTWQKNKPKRHQKNRWKKR